MEPVDEFLVAGGEAVRDCVAHQLAGAGELGLGEVGTTSQDGADHFVENVGTPVGTEHAGGGEPDEEVSQPGWMQDARVVGRIERHARLPGSLVVQAETLRFGGELVGDGPPVGIVDALVGKEVGEQHAATVADTSVGELAFLEELHQVRPGDVQDVRSLLGRELSVDGCDGHGVAVGDLGEDVDQQSQGVAGDLQGGVGVVGIERDGDPGKVGVLTKEPFEDIDGLSSLSGCGLVGDGELMVEERGLNPPWEDAVTLAVNAAAPIVSDADRDAIGLLIVGTESGVDGEKSISTWVHRYLGLGPRCRNFEVKNACYAATAGLRMALAWLATAEADGRKALIINADQSLIALGHAYETVMGAAGVAMLVSRQPRLVAYEPGACGIHAFEVTDVFRPTPRLETGDGELSVRSSKTTRSMSARRRGLRRVTALSEVPDVMATRRSSSRRPVRASRRAPQFWLVPAGARLTCTSVGP